MFTSYNHVRDSYQYVSIVIIHHVYYIYDNCNNLIRPRANVELTMSLIQSNLLILNFAHGQNDVLCLKRRLCLVAKSLDPERCNFRLSGLNLSFSKLICWTEIGSWVVRRLPQALDLNKQLVSLNNFRKCLQAYIRLGRENPSPSQDLTSWILASHLLQILLYNYNCCCLGFVAAAPRYVVSTPTSKLQCAAELTFDLAAINGQDKELIK